jgi:hypothetical protein
MPLMKWARPTLRGMHAASRKLLVIPAHGGRLRLAGPCGPAITRRAGSPVTSTPPPEAAVMAKAAFRFGCWR